MPSTQLYEFRFDVHVFARENYKLSCCVAEATYERTDANHGSCRSETRTAQLETQVAVISSIVLEA